MGLAATQARFLAVTSRKANCEYRSMALSRQKLSLTRELDDAASEYHNALNATRLVWDADGMGNYQYELTYDLMMSPSDYNQYMPYLLSRQDGKIALDDKMMKSMEGIFNIDAATGTTDGGIIYNGKVVYRGDAEYADAQKDAFDKFIDALRTNKAMSSSTAEIMKDNVSPIYQYDPYAGVGGELLGREKSNIATANGMMSYIDFIVDNTMSGYFPVGSEEAKLAEKLIFDFEKRKLVTSEEEKREKGYPEDLGQERYNLNGAIDSSWSKSSVNLLINGGYVNNQFQKPEEFRSQKDGLLGQQYSTSAYTLADLLNEDVTLLVNGRQDINNILEMVGKMITGVSDVNNSDLISKDVDQWFDSMAGPGAYKKLASKAQKGDTKAKAELAVMNYLDSLAKSMYALLMPQEGATNVDTNAFFTAMMNTISRLRNTSSDNYVEKMRLGGKSEAFGKSAVENADDYNCWVKYGDEWAISLSNLTESFLTDFVNGMDSYQDGCLITKNAKTSTYITDDPSYMYTVNMVDDSKSGVWQSEFYSIIFNNICNNGAYENEQVNDKVYLDNALKNAQLFVVSKGNDNYFYQSRYTEVNGGHVVMESDTAAIEVAEREYSYKKSQINYKEERIELESKQIEAELSALNTEMQTVQNLIKTNVEKTFKQFSS